MTKKLNDEEMNRLGLVNDSRIQTVIIKLDADKPRELKFRQYLDSKREDGHNMKETILNMFEILSGEFAAPTASLINTKNIGKKDLEETEQKTDVDVSDFEGI